MVQQKVNLETVETTAFSKMLSSKIILKLKRLGAKHSVILNHVDPNHIITNSNHSNQVNLNYANSNQLISANLTKINDSAGFCALHKIFSWYGDSTDAEAITVSTILPLVYIL